MKIIFFLQNYQFLERDQWRYLESASHSTPGIKFLRRFHEILKTPISNFASVGEIQRQVSRELLIFAEDNTKFNEARSGMFCEVLKNFQILKIFNFFNNFISGTVEDIKKIIKGFFIEK